MDAKIQKEFKLTIGTNDESKDREYITQKAMELEHIGNKEMDVRVHIFEKED